MNPIRDMSYMRNMKPDSVFSLLPNLMSFTSLMSKKTL